MRAEASDKLSGSWREKTVDALVKQVADGQTPSLNLLRELHAHLTAASQNKHLTGSVRAPHAAVAGWSALVALLGVLAYSGWVFLYGASSDHMQWAKMLILGICAGALGGVLVWRSRWAASICARRFPMCTCRAWSRLPVRCWGDGGRADLGPGPGPVRLAVDRQPRIVEGGGLLLLSRRLL